MSTPAPHPRPRILLDCDPGHDDAIAIVVAARHTDLLGITITWCDGSLRRVQAQCERIQRGSYDLILSATGFQVHGVDSALARAASAAGVPYVRVNRGRPVACVQAIAREFGLTSDTYHAIGPAKAAAN